MYVMLKAWNCGKTWYIFLFWVALLMSVQMKWTVHLLDSLLLYFAYYFNEK